ncbi:hypothetical protein DC20_20965 [Rufibacter tibetensis]|uniref:Uncharacterized protein n=1 Tax=Rufibacter tibetensis TaxID=512763 RepID=A0A0P0CGE9_9BACT|nr:hypothetical protein DC20_20965 [Rufibacter tibetensis]
MLGALRAAGLADGGAQAAYLPHVIQGVLIGPRHGHGRQAAQSRSSSMHRSIIFTSGSFRQEVAQLPHSVAHL